MKNFKLTNYYIIFSVSFEVGKKTYVHDVPTIIARTLKAKNAIKRTINCLQSIPEGNYWWSQNTNKKLAKINKRSDTHAC